MKHALLFLGCLMMYHSGCGRPRLYDHRDLTIEIGDFLTIPIDPIDFEQTIKVVADSPDSPIHVYVYLKENEAEIERKITLGKPPENLLANQNDSEQISLEAIVPARKEVTIRLQPAGRYQAQVHLEITN